MGCNSCKTSTPAIIPDENKKPVECMPDLTPPPSSSPISVQKPSPKFKPRQLPEKIYEDFILVWLNPSADDDPTVQETEETLQELVNVVITYADPDECHAFIDSIKDEKIFLVVSGTMVEQFAPRVQQASQVDAIYCLSSEEEEDNIKKANILGLVDIATNMLSLREKVEVGIKKCGRNLIKPVAVENKRERIWFMYDQLFQGVIVDCKDNSREEFCQFCEKHLSNNKDEKEKAKEKNYLTELKETYSKKNAIYWYTKEGCLYAVVNRALRRHDYETLYELRVFIRHLHEQIKKQQKETANEIQTLYRG